MKARRAAFSVPSSGFTLLEILIALSVFVLIIGGVFAISRGTLELSNDITQVQEQSNVRQNFIEFLRSSFRRLPAEAEIQMGKAKSGNGTAITVFNGGDAFSPGDPIAPDGSIELFSKESPGGDFTVGLRILDGDQTNAARTNTGRALSKASGKETVLPLVENIVRFDWEFFDATQNNWVKEWKDQQRPMFARVELALEDGQPSTYVFWIPPILRNPNNGGGAPAGAVGPDGQPIPVQPGQPGQAPPATNPNVNPSPAPQLQ
jgi:prepilin-type N-terminal cleavage/methylation domain-containing protein